MRSLHFLVLLVILSYCKATATEDDPDFLESQFEQLKGEIKNLKKLKRDDLAKVENLRRQLKESKKLDDVKNQLLKEHEAKMKEARVEREEHREEQTELLKELLESNKELQKTLKNAVKNVKQQTKKLQLLLSIENDVVIDPELIAEDSPQSDKNITAEGETDQLADIVEEDVTDAKEPDTNEMPPVVDAPERRGLILGDESTEESVTSAKNQSTELSSEKPNIGIEDRLEVSTSPSEPVKPSESPFEEISEELNKLVNNQQAIEEIISSNFELGHQIDTTTGKSKQETLLTENVSKPLETLIEDRATNQPKITTLDVAINENLNDNVTFQPKTASSKEESGISLTEDVSNTKSDKNVSSQQEIVPEEAITTNESATHVTETVSSTEDVKSNVKSDEKVTNQPEISSGKAITNNEDLNERVTHETETVSNVKEPEVSLTEDVSNVKSNEKVTNQSDIASAEAASTSEDLNESTTHQPATTSKKEELEVSSTEDVSNVGSEKVTSQPEIAQGGAISTSEESNKRTAHQPGTESSKKELEVSSTEDVSNVKSDESITSQAESTSTESVTTNEESNEKATHQPETVPHINEILEIPSPEDLTSVGSNESVTNQAEIAPEEAITINQGPNESETHQPETGSNINEILGIPSTEDLTSVVLDEKVTNPPESSLDNHEDLKNSSMQDTSDIRSDESVTSQTEAVSIKNEDIKTLAEDTIISYAKTTENNSKNPETPIISAAVSIENNAKEPEISTTSTVKSDNSNLEQSEKDFLFPTDIEHSEIQIGQTNSTNSEPEELKESKKSRKSKFSRKPSSVRDYIKRKAEKRRRRLQKYKDALRANLLTG